MIPRFHAHSISALYMCFCVNPIAIKNKKKHQKNYSGKKKMHTRKSVIISDRTRKVLVITKQKSGRRHDKLSWTPLSIQ